VGLVDLDEVACRAGGGIGWYGYSLSQGRSDLRLRELQGNRGSQEVERAAAGGRITRSEVLALPVVAEDPAGIEPAEPVELLELPVVPTVGNPPTALTGSTR
jgi:hypothetical protein